MDINLFNILSLSVRFFPLTNISSKFLDMALTEWVNKILSHPLNVSRMKLAVYGLWVMHTFSTAQQNLPAKNRLWKMNITLSYSITLTASSVEENMKNSHSAKRLLCDSLQWNTTSLRSPSHGQTIDIVFFFRGQIVFFYTQIAKLSAISSTGTVTGKPYYDAARRSLTKMMFSQDWYFLFHWTDDCNLDTRPENLCRYNTHCFLFHKKLCAPSFGLYTGALQLLH